MAVTFESPNPHFENMILTGDGITIQEKLENGFEDIPWADAVIAPNSGTLTASAVPKSGVMYGVCHGVHKTDNELQLHCTIANTPEIVPAWLGVYANCSLDGDDVVFTGQTLIAKCQAKDPCLFNHDPDGMQASPDKVFSFQIRANLTSTEVETLTTMQERDHVMNYKVVSE